MDKTWRSRAVASLRVLRWGTCVSALLAVGVAHPATAHQSSPFSVNRLSDHIRTLSSDAFEGRAPATRGEDQTVAYLIRQLHDAGLEPAGDQGANGREWTQAVPLTRVSFEQPPTLVLRQNQSRTDWSQGQIRIGPALSGDREVAIANAPLVFVGYGVTAPERQWDDFKDIDLNGKIAVVLVNDPDFESGAGDFGGRAMTYYGRWTYKFEEAARRGALGVLIVHDDAGAGYGWETTMGSNAKYRFDIIRSNPKSAHTPVEGWMQNDIAERLFADGGLNFQAEKQRAQSRDFVPVVIPDATLSVGFRITQENVVSRNVIAMRPGTVRPGETVFYMAHWDHLGIGDSDAEGDQIYNGAVDNASGIAQMLELAQAFGEAPPPERTVVFMAVTAEEKGLLGTEFYVANPLFPLATTAAAINMDGAAVNGPARDVSTDGDTAALTLQDDLEALAIGQGRYFTPDPKPEDGQFYRSDHFPFSKAGVPALSFKSGQDLVEGGRAAGAALAERYTRERYHKPADEFDPAWDLSGMIQDLRLLYDLGRGLAMSNSWPEWKPGSEFKGVRDASAEARQQNGAARHDFEAVGGADEDDVPSN